MLTSDKQIILKAHKKGYAIVQVNVNNLEWIKAALEAAEALKSPIILGISERAAEYMGGFRTVVCLIRELDAFYGISVPVIVHLDHGSFLGSKKALEAGFNSIMFDGSRYTFRENLTKTEEITGLCHKKGILIEAEIGVIGGEEEGIICKGEIADPEECLQMSNLGIDMLAAGIGNMHGKYPSNWLGLNFDVLAKIRFLTKKNVPLVLHGGTGIPFSMIKKAISLGVVKININTEFQKVFAKSIRKYINEGKDLVNNGFNPRKLLKSGYLAIKKEIKNKLMLFGSVNQA